MQTIYKYQLKQTDIQSLELPASATILTVQHQPSYGLVLWAIVDPDKETESRRIAIFGTGNPFGVHPFTEISNAFKFVYISTVQMPGGLAWHIFEQIGYKRGNVTRG